MAVHVVLSWRVDDTSRHAPADVPSELELRIKIPASRTFQHALST
jgi:hypothetical protein